VALDRLVSSHRLVEEIYPLSPMQQGMLFHTLLDPHTGVYCEQLSCTLYGDLDVAVFQRLGACEAVPSVLRSVCLGQLEQPLQLVLQRVRLPFVQEDWRDRPLDEQQSAAGSLPPG
jgi:hypothetical protein